MQTLLACRRQAEANPLDRRLAFQAAMTAMGRYQAAQENAEFEVAEGAVLAQEVSSGGSNPAPGHGRGGARDGHLAGRRGSLQHYVWRKLVISASQGLVIWPRESVPCSSDRTQLLALSRPWESLI